MSLLFVYRITLTTLFFLLTVTNCILLTVSLLSVSSVDTFCLHCHYFLFTVSVLSVYSVITFCLQCHIDGPYGTATREIFETEHAVLIGAGIGVTPMASILQSIMYRYKESKRICPNCHQSFYGVIPESVMNLKKVKTEQRRNHLQND